EREAVVEVEVAACRRKPREAPAHSPPVGSDRWIGSTRDGDHRDVAVVEVDGDAVEVVHPERAVWAARVDRPRRVRSRGFGVEHGVVDDQLTPAVEHLAQRLHAALALELVVLLDQLPRELTPLAAQLVAESRELLLLDEVLSSPPRSHDGVTRPSA